MGLFDGWNRSSGGKVRINYSPKVSIFPFNNITDEIGRLVMLFWYLILGLFAELRMLVQ